MRVSIFAGGLAYLADDRPVLYLFPATGQLAFQQAEDLTQFPARLPYLWDKLEDG